MGVDGPCFAARLVAREGSFKSSKRARMEAGISEDLAEVG